MTVACKVCKYELRSPKNDIGAVQDLLKKMGQHMGAAHPEHATELGVLLATVQSLAATYLLFQYADIPVAEVVLQGAYRENRDALMNILQSSPFEKDEIEINSPATGVN